MAADGFVELLEDRPGGEQVLGGAEGRLHGPQLLVAQHGGERVEDYFPRASAGGCGSTRRAASTTRCPCTIPSRPTSTPTSRRPGAVPSGLSVTKDSLVSGSVVSFPDAREPWIVRECGGS